MMKVVVVKAVMTIVSNGGDDENRGVKGDWITDNNNNHGCCSGSL